MKWKHATYSNTDSPWAGTATWGTPFQEFISLCKADETFFPMRRANNEKYDNTKYYIRPLECKLKKTTFFNIEEWGPEADFDRFCVDLERGDTKPQIRVHGNSYFNITNFA